MNGNSPFLPLLRACGWTREEAARRFGVSERTIRRWIAGTSPVPPAVAEYAAKVAAWFERNPAPEKSAGEQK